MAKKSILILGKISIAACQHKRVQIYYFKSDFPFKERKLIKREVAFYSTRDGLLFGTDTKDGNGRIKSFRIDRIRSVRILNKKFIPKWEIEL